MIRIQTLFVSGSQIVQTRFSEEFSRKRNSHAVSTDGPIAVHASAHSPSPIEYVRETKRRRNSLNSPPSSSLRSRASTDTSPLSSTPTPELDAYADWIRETHGAVESSSALSCTLPRELSSASPRLTIFSRAQPRSHACFSTSFFRYNECDQDRSSPTRILLLLRAE